MHADERKEIKIAKSGDIVAVVGLKNTNTGHTVCDEKHGILLESMDFPEPVVEVSVEPVSKAEQDNLSKALAKLSEEDPTFKLSTNEDTGQTIIAGMGELHLEILIDRLLREFKVQAHIGKPQVAFSEAITKKVEKIDEKFVRQSGGRGLFLKQIENELLSEKIDIAVHALKDNGLGNKICYYKKSRAWFTFIL